MLVNNGGRLNSSLLGLSVSLLVGLDLFLEGLIGGRTRRSRLSLVLSIGECLEDAGEEGCEDLPEIIHE